MRFLGSQTATGVIARVATGLGLWLSASLAWGAYELNLQKPVTPIAGKILTLHNSIMLICLVIFVLVFGVMFYSVFAHRKSRGAKAAQFHENATLEVIWTIVPFAILVGLAIPSAATLIEMEDTSKSELTVRVTGYQWKWKYDFPDQNVSFMSVLATPREQIENKAPKGPHYLLEVDNPIVLPVGKKIRFQITANDVIHAWWVPALGVKKDAIPGFVNEVWTYIDEPGTYRGQCAELCGKDHGFMPIVVNAVSQADFDKWVVAQKQQAAAAGADATKKWTTDELMAKGKQVYATCGACHGGNGEGVGPFPKLAGSKIATGPVKDHLNIVMNGKPGTAMQAFASQMNDVDIAAVVTYERNSFGNKTGDVVQPADVKALRK